MRFLGSAGFAETFGSTSACRYTLPPTRGTWHPVNGDGPDTLASGPTAADAGTVNTTETRTAGTSSRECRMARRSSSSTEGEPPGSSETCDGVKRGAVGPRQLGGGDDTAAVEVVLSAPRREPADPAVPVSRLPSDRWTRPAPAGASPSRTAVASPQTCRLNAAPPVETPASGRPAPESSPSRSRGTNVDGIACFSSPWPPERRPGTPPGRAVRETGRPRGQG